MIIDLQGRRALVTGSTGGIGLATAVGLARAGASVVVNGRARDRVDAAVAAVGAAAAGSAGSVEGVVADLSTSDGAAALVDAVGTVDLLVNNLGIYGPGEFAEIPDAEWERLFQVNVMSGVRLSRSLMPPMVARGWGRIVFVSSESALHIPPDMIHYGMTKTAQIALARGLAELAAGTGVTVNAVLPGPTRTEATPDFLRKMAGRADADLDELEREFIARHRPTSLLRRMATPEEVASLIVYVCSDQASATTGAALRVDGGVVRAIP